MTVPRIAYSISVPGTAERARREVPVHRGWKQRGCRRARCCTAPSAVGAYHRSVPERHRCIR
eukprot:320742-Rhodomonas_salina.1